MQVLNRTLLSSMPYWIFDLDGALTVPVHNFEYFRRQLEIPSDADILGHIDGLTPVEASKCHSRLYGRHNSNQNDGYSDTYTWQKSGENIMLIKDSDHIDVHFSNNGLLTN